MKRIIRLTESDLTRIVKKVIRESEGGFIDRVGKKARKLFGKYDNELEIWFSDADSEIASENNYVFPAYYGEFDNLESDLASKVLDLFYDCKENLGEEGYQEFKNGLDRLYDEYKVKEK